MQAAHIEAPRKRRRVPARASVHFQADLLASIPTLRKYAMSLTGCADRAGDLVQETLAKAWCHQAQFEPGTNLTAWLFCILRNEFYTLMRKRRREVEDIDGMYSRRLARGPEQPHLIVLKELTTALQRLPASQKRALLLVSVDGLSYREAAQICHVEVGTIKSRISRARTHLMDVMLEDTRKLEYDMPMQAAIAANTLD